MGATDRFIGAVARRYVAARRPRRNRRPPSTDKIYFLVVTIDGFGGVGRAVATHVAALADLHDVEIVSVYRRRDEPVFAIDPRVRVTYLEDQRRPGGEIDPNGSTWIRARNIRRRSLVKYVLDGRTSRFAPPQETELSLLTDLLLFRHLSKLEPGVLITARPALHAAAAALAPPHLLTIAHEHVHADRRMQRPDLEEIVRGVAEHYDAIVTLTEPDAEDYRRAFPNTGALITSVPNPAPWEPIGTMPELDRKVVVSAGRLHRRKGFDRLIAAYAPIASKHPDWQLHIYGHGPELNALRELVHEYGIEQVVSLKGFTDDMPTALSSGSIYALASRFESFGMVLLEAMSRGLPLVSYDAPRGPAQILDDGRNGRLVPNGDTDAMTAALLELIEDDRLRQRMGEAALADVTKYDPAVIAARWDDIFAEVLRRRSHS